jgi:hypothetical protein
MDNIHIQQTPSVENADYENPEETKNRSSNERLLAQNNLIIQKFELRKEYANKSFWLAVFWTGFVVILTGLQFYKPLEMNLNKTEFISIVATALASIISLYLQVGRGIYVEKLEEL